MKPNLSHWDLPCVDHQILERSGEVTMLYTHYMQLHQSKEPFAVHLGKERRRMIPICLWNHALPTQNRRFQVCLAEELPYQRISMQILQKAME